MPDFNLNKLIGVPFKLNGKDFSGCDCRGIVWLYYKYVKDRELPFTDGKRVIFRNKNKDIPRMLEVLNQFCILVGSNDIREGDIVILKAKNNIGALGVCINDKYLLHMDKIIGSCLTRIKYAEEMFLYVFRPLN